MLLGRNLCLGGVPLLLLLTTPAPAVTIYSDRAAFDAASAGENIFGEDFEGTVLPPAGAPSADFGLFTVTEVSSDPELLESSLDNVVSRGLQALTFNSNEPSEVVFLFDLAIQFFAIDINDWGQRPGDLSVSSNTGSFDELLGSVTGNNPNPSGQTIFFGVMDPDGFTSVTITTTNDAIEAVGLDDLAFGGPGVPEPGTLSLLALAAGLAIRRRR